MKIDKEIYGQKYQIYQDGKTIKIFKNKQLFKELTALKENLDAVQLEKILRLYAME